MSTWIMMAVAGLVLGLCYFLMLRRDKKRAERLESFKGKVAVCPNSANHAPDPDGNFKTANLVILGVWKRDGLRGSLWDCASCGQTSWWDMDRQPPVLRASDEPRKPRRRRGK